VTSAPTDLKHLLGTSTRFREYNSIFKLLKIFIIFLAVKGTE